MSFAEFTQSLQAASAPALPDGPLLALWHEGKGDWEKAHRCVQDDASRDGAWVHAYLHRKEGDTGNAAYWYARARQPAQNGDLWTEWETMVKALLASRV